MLTISFSIWYTVTVVILQHNQCCASCQFEAAVTNLMMQVYAAVHHQEG